MQVIIFQIFVCQGGSFLSLKILKVNLYLFSIFRLKFRIGFFIFKHKSPSLSILSTLIKQIIVIQKHMYPILQT